MIILEIRYIAGLGLISRQPSPSQSLSLIRKFSTETPHNFSETSIVYKIDSLDQGVQICKNLAEKLETCGFFPAEPNSLPFHAVIHKEAQPPEEIWKLVAQGNIILPKEEKFPGAHEWLYDWELYPFTKDPPVSNRLFPLRSLLLLGRYKKECFFCGSHDHFSEKCQSCWHPAPNAFTINKLASMAPASWVDQLRSQQNNSLTDGLAFIKQDIRQQFSWHFLKKICQTTATYHSELDKAPLKPAHITNVHDILEAIEASDITKIKTTIETGSTKKNEINYQLIKGFYCLQEGESDRAMRIWWEAENLSSTPIRKSYAAILQARLHFLQGNIPAALSAASRAYKDDNSFHTLYWQIIYSIIEGKNKHNIGNIKLLTKSPKWMTQAVIDPILLQHQTDVEETFKAVWRDEESLLMKKIKQVEKLMENTSNAFGEEVISKQGVKLRDLLGSLADMGFSGMKKNENELNQIKKEIQKETNKKIHVMLKNVPVLQKRCKNILDRIPKNRKTRPIRMQCVEIINRLINISQRKKLTDPDKQKGLQNELAEIDKQFKALQKAHREYLEKEWQSSMIKKYIIYFGTAILVIWFIVYLTKFF